MYHTGMGVSGHGIPPMHTMSQYYYPQRFFPQMPFRGVHQNIPPPLNQYPWLQAENHDHQKSPNTQGQRKKRAAFSKKQLSELEKEFEESRFCSKQRRAGLAASLELSDYQVKVWFQNRRMKWKKRFSGSEDRKKADQVKKDSIGDEGSAIPQHLFKQDCNALSSVKDLLKGTTSALQPLSHQINYVNWDHTDTKPEKYVHTISSTSNTYC